MCISLLNMAVGFYVSYFNVYHFVEYYNNNSLCCLISPVLGGFLFFRNLSCFSWFVVAVVVVVAVHVILSGTGWTLRVFPIM